MKEEKCDDLAATLHMKEETVTSLTNEKAKYEKEALSRMSNQNQALVLAKQASAQLTDQVELHQRKQYELAQKLEDLELAGSREGKGTPLKLCRVCRKREGVESCTPVRTTSSIHSILTPSRIFMPAVSEADTLRTENKKLKQDLSCLQTNFELTTRKSSQFRSEVKELESSAAEMQNLFDKNLTEKMELQSRLEEVKDGLKGQEGLQAAEKEKVDELSQQVETLQGELERLQEENFNFEEKLMNGADHTLEGQGMIAKLDSVKQSLTEEKSVMEGEMTALRSELEKLQDISQSLKNSSSTHQQDSKKKTGTISSLKLKVSKLTKEKSELAGQLTSASEKLDQACDKIQLHKDEIEAMEVDLRAKDRQIAVLSSERKDQSRLPVEVETLRTKVIETLEEMATLRFENKSLEDARKKLEAKVAELSKASTKLQRESKHSSELARRMNTELEKMEEKVQSLEADGEAKGMERDTAQRKLKDSKAELSLVSRAKADSEEEMKKLIEKLSEVEQQTFELAAKLADRKHQADVATGKHSSVEQKLAELEAKLDAAEFAVLEKDSHISDLKCVYELMESENSTLLSQVTSLSEMVSTRNFKLEAHQMQTVRQESDIYEIMERVAELETEHGSCAKIISELKEANEGMKATLETRASLEREIEGKVTSLKAQVKDLEKSVSSLESSKGDLQEEIALQAAKNEDLVQKYADAGNRERQLERELRAESLALAAARDDLSHANRTQKDTEEKMDEKVEALEMKCSDCVLRCMDFSREKTELKSRLLELQRDLREKALLGSALQIEKNSLSEQFESFKMSALSVVQSEYASSADVVMREEEENLSTLSSSKGGRGIRKKKPHSRKVLHPVQDLLD